MSNPDPMRRWCGKDPVDVVAILEARLARAHRANQALLGDPKRTVWSCVFDNGDSATVYCDELGAGLDDALAAQTGADTLQGSMVARRADGATTIMRVYAPGEAACAA